MAKRLAWTDPAKADIRAIDQQPALQVLKTLARFLKSGEGDIKQLHGYDPPLFRLRAQDYRTSSATKTTPSRSLASSIARKPTADAGLWHPHSTEQTPNARRTNSNDLE